MEDLEKQNTPTHWHDDPRFERRVLSITQSFTGIDRSGRPALSYEDIDRHVQRGRDLRSEALIALVRGAAASLVRLVRTALAFEINLARKAAKAIGRAHKRQKAIAGLMALDDRVLKNIDLHRSQLASVVEEILNAPSPDDASDLTLAEMTGTTRKTDKAAANDDNFESAA